MKKEYVLGVLSILAVVFAVGFGMYLDYSHNREVKRGIIRMCERVAASGGTLTPYSVRCRRRIPILPVPMAVALLCQST